MSNPAAEAVIQQHCRELKLAAVAVSYTHLTLPTILLV